MSAPPIDLGDPDARRRWLGQVRELIADATAAGLDAAAPKRRRVLSRAEARRKLREATKALEVLLDAAGGADAGGAGVTANTA